MLTVDILTSAYIGDCWLIASFISHSPRKSVVHPWSKHILQGPDLEVSYCTAEQGPTNLGTANITTVPCSTSIQECRRGAHLPSLGREPVAEYTTEVCDAYGQLLRRQTYGYLPSRRASPLLDRRQIILLGDRGSRVWTTCPRLLNESARPWVEPATFGVASPTPWSLRYQATHTHM